ncbi:DUF4328 domain-containing protein [Micromonospora sp. MS34]|uniref:DUF4328 domain-containing protein n=1 Tax=Micromonospora sp. MS34 TaxID=3385971 RepID=UPI00399F1EBC
MPTFSVRGFGLAAAMGVGLTTVLFTALALAPAVAAVRLRASGAAGGADVERQFVAVQGVLSLAYPVAFLVAAALVMIWMFRARKNTDAFPGFRSSLAAHWAIAGWWVPVASLGLPCVVMVGIVRDSLGRARWQALVAVWWVSWLVFDIGNLISNLADLQADVRLAERSAVRDFDHYRDAALRNCVPALALLVAGVSLVVLMLKISTAQHDRISRATSAWPPAGPPPVPAADPVQPVTGPSPQVATYPTVASPQV